MEAEEAEAEEAVVKSFAQTDRYFGGFLIALTRRALQLLAQPQQLCRT